jgi:hypothetical protein
MTSLDFAFATPTATFEFAVVGDAIGRCVRRRDRERLRLMRQHVATDRISVCVNSVM